MDDQPSPITIVIADDDTRARRELVTLLDSDPKLRVIYEAMDVNHALTLMRRHNPHIVFLDLAIARQCKVQSSDACPTGHIRTRTIVTLATLNGQQIIEALRLGAAGIVLKSPSSNVLLQSIRNAISGNLWLERRIAATLAETLRGHSSSKNATVRPEEYKLTRRELDIIASIAGGRTNREVSQDYAISERTVKHHLTNIFGKVGVSTRLELALFAVDHHLVTKETPLSLRMQMDVSE